MTSRKAVEKNQTTMADSTLPQQYEAVFILANEGLDSYCEYVESNEITFFLNDEEERYFQDQGRISSSERKEFILKTSRLVNKKPGPASSSGGEDQGSGDNSDNVDASSTTTTTEVKTDNISKEDALDSTDASNVVGMDMSGDYTLFIKQPVYVLFQPPLYDGLPHIQDLICESILNARSNIRISMFVFTDVFIYNTLCQATTTGAVTIDILLDATQVRFKNRKGVKKINKMYMLLVFNVHHWWRHLNFLTLQKKKNLMFFYAKIFFFLNKRIKSKNKSKTYEY